VLGKYVRQRASKDKPAARSIAVLLNLNDDTISNPQTWSPSTHGAITVASVQHAWLPEHPRLQHDVIDPGHGGCDQGSSTCA
jgi:N-acetylmuramoyl-L-alanine amidase